MGACVRYILLALATAALAMLFEPFFSEALRRAGIDSAEWVAPIMNGVAAAASLAWLNVLAISIVGAAVGAWAHYLASVLDRKTPRKEARLSGLVSQFDNLKGDLAGLLIHWRAYPYQLGNWSGDAYGKLIALHASLHKLGIKFPHPAKIRSTDDCINRVERIITFLSIMREIAYKGHLKETKEFGKEITVLFDLDFPAGDSREALQKESR